MRNVIPDTDSLASWNEGPAKQAIHDFVAAVTQQNSPDFVPVAERIATFDNDGTLWAEQPLYFQLNFAIDRVKALAAAAPGVEGKGAVQVWSWADDVNGALAGGQERVNGNPLPPTHSGMTTEEFANTSLKDWLDTCETPQNAIDLYSEMIYQPMLELLGLFPSQWIQNLHRVRRWRRFHARFFGEGLRHPPRPGIGSVGELKFETA